MTLLRLEDHSLPARNPHPPKYVSSKGVFYLSFFVSHKKYQFKKDFLLVLWIDIISIFSASVYPIWSLSPDSSHLFLYFPLRLSLTSTRPLPGRGWREWRARASNSKTTILWTPAILALKLQSPTAVTTGFLHECFYVTLEPPRGLRVHDWTCFALVDHQTALEFPKRDLFPPLHVPLSQSTGSGCQGRAGQESWSTALEKMPWWDTATEAHVIRGNEAMEACSRLGQSAGSKAWTCWDIQSWATDFSNGVNGNEINNKSRNYLRLGNSFSTGHEVGIHKRVPTLASFQTSSLTHSSQTTCEVPGQVSSVAFLSVYFRVLPHSWGLLGEP